MSNGPPQLARNPWPHRLAVALVCATFPLLWVGGLVTSYSAGMAVPDWPTTYGYNLFLYPWQTWILGPWDLFIEHGHRLLGATVGMITIGLLVAVWLREPRHWVWYVAIGALALVCGQGALGGLRVLEDQRQLAKLHGCIGPLFFALTVALAAFTSRWWSSTVRRVHPQAGRLQGIAIATAVLAYVQIVLGAHVRHLPDGTSPEMFRLYVVFHLVMAGMVALHVLLLNVRVLRNFHDEPLIRRPTIVLGLLLMAQLLLGVGTWVVHYNVPAWFSKIFGWTAGYTVQAQSLLQAHLTTAHVAGGSLIFATAVVIAIRSVRLFEARGRARASRSIARGGGAMSTMRTVSADAISTPPAPIMGDGWPALSMSNGGEVRPLADSKLNGMSGSPLSFAVSANHTLLGRVADYIALTKPRISVMVLVTVAVAMFVGAWGPPAPWLLLHTLVGTALVAASASALNQRLERATDARMARTADRPLPSGRLSDREVLAFGAASIVGGSIYLGLAVNWLTAALGLLTWVLYVVVYTPLKTRTPLNTVVGAVAGAMPTMMGWAAVGASFSLAPGADGMHAATLFLIVYLWQFPHFMAIAWIYRRQYAVAGLQMLTVVDPSGRRAGRQGLTAALALLPVSLAPALSHAGPAYFAAALVLGLGYLAAAAWFYYRRTDVAAGWLLRISLLYLPALLALMMLAPLV